MHMIYMLIIIEYFDIARAHAYMIYALNICMYTSKASSIVDKNKFTISVKEAKKTKFL